MCDKLQLDMEENRSCGAELASSIKDVESQIVSKEDCSRQRLTTIKHRMRDIDAKNRAIEHIATARAPVANTGR